MSSTLLQAPLPRSRPLFCVHGSKSAQDWKLTLIEVKILYLQRRYKHCITRCEKLLERNEFMVREIHQVFLHFYAAICHESLGLIAHTYSVKKLSFLNQARGSFQAALDVLPKPKTVNTITADALEDPFSDPVSPVNSTNEDEGRSTAGTTIRLTSNHTPSKSPRLKRANNPVPRSDTLADIESSLKFNSRPSLTHPDPPDDIEASLHLQNDVRDDVMLRSSASSIRSYNTARLTASEIGSNAALRSNNDSTPLLPRPLNVTKKLAALPGPPPARPLPPLPPVTPSPTRQQRKTGLVTSINTHVAAQNAAKERLWCPLPRIFAPDDDKENVPPLHVSPEPRNPVSPIYPLNDGVMPRKPLAALGQSPVKRSSRHNRLLPQLLEMDNFEARHRSHLRDFALQLTAHIMSVGSTIAETSFLQQEHRRKKLQAHSIGGGREASYWLLPNGAEAVGEGDTRNRKDLRERTVRLRKEGWRVTKEKAGWKGEEYYKGLRERACLDMEEKASKVYMTRTE